MTIGETCTLDVATTNAEQSLLDAARMMREHIDDLVIVDPQDAPTGIITDRDIVVGVLGVGLDATELAAGDVTALRVAVVGEGEGEDVFTAVGRMRELGVRRLPSWTTRAAWSASLRSTTSWNYWLARCAR